MRCLDARLSSKQGVFLVASQVAATDTSSATAVSDKLAFGVYTPLVARVFSTLQHGALISTGFFLVGVIGPAVRMSPCCSFPPPLTTPRIG